MRSPQHGGIISKLILLLTLVALCGLLYLFRHPLLRAAGEYLVVEDPLRPADAIIVFGDDNYLGDRAARAAELYREGWAPRVVASGRQLRPYAGVSELIQQDLVGHGVPAAAVVRFPHTAASTREEAEALRRLVAERGWRRILVVTSSHHTRRARYICRRVFPPEVEVRLAAAGDSEYDPNHWWESRQGMKLFLIETVGMGAAMWELRHASESQPASAGSPAPAPAP